MEPLFKGLVMGFCIAAPVGPIGLLCIRRSMADGRATGFVSGLGAATADAVYGTIAALGLTAITRFLLDHARTLQLLGGGFLLYLGLALLFAKPTAGEAAHPGARTLLSAYGSTFLLTLANPATILSFIGIFAGLGVGLDTTGIAPAAQLVSGVFVGSAAWWLLLSTGADYLAGKGARHRLRWINVGSGLAIAGFGAWQLAAVLR